MSLISPASGGDRQFAQLDRDHPAPGAPRPGRWSAGVIPIPANLPRLPLQVSVQQVAFPPDAVELLLTPPMHPGWEGGSSASL